MSAEILRRAAALMRERAEAAKGGVWGFGEERGALMSEWAIFSPDAGHDFAMCENPHDAEHIASWHPAVALAVADALDDLANDAEAQAAEGYDIGPRHPLLTVARLYLGEAADD